MAPLQIRIRQSGIALLLAALPLAAAHAADVVATVNGSPIDREDVQQYQQEQGAGVDQDRDERAVIDELIARELVYQDALAKGLEKQPEVQAELEDLRRRVLLNTAIEKALEDNPVSEQAMKALYEEQLARFDATEYNASHILVEEKAEAEALIEQLEKGADFAALAKEHSTGPSGPNGGELGWFGPQQMVPPFSEAVQELDKGEITKAPVQTQFGWHVIKLNDARKQEPPGYEAVKPQLEQALQQQHIAEYLESLRAEATVEYQQ